MVCIRFAVEEPLKVLFSFWGYQVDIGSYMGSRRMSFTRAAAVGFLRQECMREYMESRNFETPI